jgi:hypothetical protein
LFLKKRTGKVRPLDVDGAAGSGSPRWFDLLTGEDSPFGRVKH